MYNKKIVFAMACLGLLLFGVSLITLGSITVDLKQKFVMDEIAKGALFSILPIGILTGSLLFGPLSDRYGYKMIFVASGFLLAAGFAGIAYADTIFLLRVCIFFFGLAGGAINGATNAIVSDISTEARGANLSLLGVSFGIGALGMPFLLASLRSDFSFKTILTAVAVVTFIVSILFLFTRFPPPKQSQGFPLKKSLSLFRDTVIILIAFFLFMQSSFEAVINNWTTTYLTKQHSVSENNALYALSLYVVGMTAMRLLTGSAFRSLAPAKVLAMSFAFILAGTGLMKFAESFQWIITGMILLGAGLASGFPIMLGFVGDRYKEISGTAFSFVLVIALIGNMLVNYLMGIISQQYGIHHLTTVIFAELAIMILLFVLIIRKLK